MTEDEAKKCRAAFERLNPGAVKQEELDLQAGYSSHSYTAHDLWAVFAEAWEEARGPSGQCIQTPTASSTRE